jgi:NAD(P)-dependent dehydrogenase (short-subunit alcohol dehydrogenase family)
MLRQARRPKFFAPLGSWRVAIADCPAERLGEDARVVVQVGRFRPGQIVCDLCAAPGRRRIAATARATSTDETGEVLPAPSGSASSSASRTLAAARSSDKIHLLFNNAGISGSGSMVANSRDEWERNRSISKPLSGIGC